MLAAGSIEYSLGTQPVIGAGYSWTDPEMKAALAGPVAEVFYDDIGSQQVQSLLMGIAETGFAQDSVREVLERPQSDEDWRVGEAIAEAYLVHRRECHFPWPDGRDVRRAQSSLPGADLVGFQKDAATFRFAFGEVKTSYEATYPPGALYGRTGLKQQLEDLRDDVTVRDQLVVYLTHRAVLNPTWKEQFVDAAKRYFADRQDVSIFGVLVRDVTPHSDDLNARVQKLHKGCPQKMTVELLALYLPATSISRLKATIKRPPQGGSA
jgi:hypothetical protein